MNEQMITEAMKQNHALKEFILTGEVTQAIENRLNNYLEEVTEYLSEDSYEGFLGFLEEIQDNEEEVEMLVEEWMEEITEDMFTFLPSEEYNALDFENFTYLFLLHRVFAQGYDKYISFDTQEFENQSYKQLIGSFLYSLLGEVNAVFLQHLIDNVSIFEGNYVSSLEEWKLIPILTDEEEHMSATLRIYPPLFSDFPDNLTEQWQELMTERMQMYAILMTAQLFEGQHPSIDAMNKLSEELEGEDKLANYSESTFFEVDEFIPAIMSYLEGKFEEY